MFDLNKKKNRGVFFAAGLPLGAAGAAAWIRYRRDIRRERAVFGSTYDLAQ